MIVEFNLEGNPDVSFYALYAGLRMFKDKKVEQDKKHPGQINQAGAEAYCMLQDLKEQHPKQYLESETEYDQVQEDVKFLEWLESYPGCTIEKYNNLNPVLQKEVREIYKELTNE